MELIYSIDEVHPTRDLTSHEKVFLQGLAEYTLFLGKSLFFQVCNLQKHTELVLSGEKPTRPKFPARFYIEREIAELKKMIKELSDKMEGKDLPEENRSVLEIWKSQLKELEEALNNAEVGEESTEVLGRYEHNSAGDSKVILFVDAIEERAKKIPCDTKFLMGQVLLHEYFHSFYFHVGVGTRYPFHFTEEPMAEYGSLVVLVSVASSGSAIANDAGKALTYALGFIKGKQTCTGFTASYGFGAYLYEKHKDDFPQLIARYANVSRLMEKCEKEFREYKYMLYPKYPSAPWMEDTAYKKLEALLKVVVVRESHAIRFVGKVFKYLNDNDLLDCLAPFVYEQETKNSRRLFSLSKDGCFCLMSILLDDSNPPTGIPFCPFVIGGNTYYLNLHWCISIKLARHNNTIDEFIKMINYVYRGLFDIQKTDDEYIMSYDVINN